MKPSRRIAAVTVVAALTIGSAGSVLASGDSGSASTEVYSTAAERDDVPIDSNPEAFPAAVVAAAKGFVSVYRSTSGFRNQVNRAVGDVTRSSGVFPFAAPSGSTADAAEQLLDR